MEILPLANKIRNPHPLEVRTHITCIVQQFSQVQKVEISKLINIIKI